VVQTQLGDDLPAIVADRIQCEQVVVNLLHNAYEALAKQDSPRRVIVRTECSGGQLKIQIEDNGPGIPPHQKGGLFEAFCTTKPSGMGMGLAISRTIVEDHGGRLWVSSNEQGGATFHVNLPVVLVTASLNESP
jgi:C4-dicarboxylate-specific signal transduction histidine kinase